MGLKSFFKDLYSIKNISVGANDIFSRYGLGGQRVAGQVVNTNTAMTHATVYSCIRDKSESIGQLPVKLMRKNKDGKFDPVNDGRIHRIFAKKPNEFMSAQDFRQMYVSCLELYGRFFAYVIRNDRGNVSEVIPFRYQTNVSVDMDQNGNVYYIYTTNDGKPNMGFADKEIMHIKLNTLDGFTGLSPISCNARSIGLGMAQESHLTSVMENGAMPSGVLETDQIFKDPERAGRIRDQFKEKFQGVATAGEVIFLENGLKYNPLSITPADSELLSSRQYSREEICGIFRVPPHRIGAASNITKVDVEQENKDYYVNKLMPLVLAYESAWDELTPDGITYKLDPRGFLRGDLESQVNALGEAFKLTAISINELRDGIDLEPVDNGHLHAIDTNNITLGSLEDVEKLQAENRALALAGANNQGVQQEENDDET